MSEGFSDLGAIAARLTQTPALVLRRGALERNIARMQAACDGAGVRLRAHGKMHKCSPLGRLQVAAGAVGLCAQTVGEAEAFVRGGVDDVLVSAPVPSWGAARLAALAAGGARLAAVADDAEQIARLGAAARAAGAELGVLVDVDLGQHRSGVAPGQALALVRIAAGTPGLRWGGVQAYCGHLQHVVDLGARRAAVDAATRRLAALVAELSAAELAPPVVSGGGTGTYALDLAGGVFTELQAGSYAVMDAEYAGCDAPAAKGSGGGAWAFEPALVLATSVVSRRHATHATVDAGLKALSVDGPPARVVAGAAPGSLWRPMGDEHGAIFPPGAEAWLREVGGDPLAFARAVDAANAEPPFAPGTVEPVAWLQPGHCDPTVNLHDAFLVAGEDGGLERWPIDARRVTPEPRQ